MTKLVYTVTLGYLKCIFGLYLNMSSFFHIYYISISLTAYIYIIYFILYYYSLFLYSLYSFSYLIFFIILYSLYSRGTQRLSFLNQRKKTGTKERKFIAINISFFFRYRVYRFCIHNSCLFLR